MYERIDEFQAQRYHYVCQGEPGGAIMVTACYLIDMLKEGPAGMVKMLILRPLTFILFSFLF
jgi:hypothetical protein